ADTRGIRQQGSITREINFKKKPVGEPQLSMKRIQERGSGRGGLNSEVLFKIVLFDVVLLAPKIALLELFSGDRLPGKTTPASSGGRESPVIGSISVLWV